MHILNKSWVRTVVIAGLGVSIDYTSSPDAFRRPYIAPKKWFIRLWEKFCERGSCESNGESVTVLDYASAESLTAGDEYQLKGYLSSLDASDPFSNIMEKIDLRFAGLAR